ncbi:hemagglutinin repeat-containing protein [Pectobacterium aroidearum]|uniref:hemagglutinin repeat-containing protein n=1 Tax=Pectobacterium aroidearum TaxID=1201031 RepID=UPI002114FEDE|nr:hemagglutinin repeat-containing protein [Pectobacterium aroidearum]UUE46961.1 hemagglutinin repeat-containing protein [Pectobacterium aroidearum]UUE51158.1 hemagglutinin repeat-containing protein [Pectobacterium aroidearum]UUE55387.1 hemagglutinin repeat-containing protein [Pectobacterium aroidearum]UUE63795.1 hemagglutinin repeat-containing protein [Pectobacterium aroidearum]UUE68020.1 hemagglutinin repeat-containing protein [Pectobacterium aroidearum]
MKPVKTTQRLLAYTLIHLIAFQPLLPAMAAGVQVATGNTALDQAGNGVPVINIATPNSAGISHNQYQDFNVDKPGLILNNGTAQLNPTQLGGLIQNNPNLKGKAADAIINEVVSTNRSTLAGYLEVGGKQASVIVANPNGITCDGCGFINTPQVTLTTGKPKLDAQGNLQHIDVTRGDITLTGQGLDASKSDYLSLIARTAQINAGLNANDTQIVLGANQVDATGKVTAQAADSGVKVALDTGALGGMYTNRIRLVSSDKGVGVNVGNLSARSGDITLSANGKLSLGDTVAQGNIQADADALALRGKQQAGDALTLNAKQDITLQDATLRAGQDIALSSGGGLKAQNSVISAGVDAQGTVKSANQLSLIGDAVTLGATQLAAGKVTVNAGQSLQQDAASGIKAESVLDIRGDAVSLAGSAGAEDVRLAAKTLTGAGSAQLQAKNSATVRVTQQGDWQGNLTAGNTLSVEGGRLVQRGTLAGKTLTLTLDALDNQGDIAARQGLTFSGGDMTNRGTLAAAERLTVNAQRLDNTGLLSARHDVRLELQTVLNNQGNILTDNQLFLLADTITNGGTLQAATLTAQANQFTNQGEVTANALDLTSQAAENHGTINARQMLALHGGSLVNRGTLSAGEKLALTLGDTLDNRGLMQAGNTLQVTADRLSNDGTLTAPDLQLRTSTLANQGTLQADNALQLEATRALTQSATGTLLAGTDLTVNAGQAETDGAIQAQQFLLNAERWLNTGKTSLTGDGQISATHLDNRGNLLTAGNWTIHSDVVSQAGALQGNALTLQANTLTSSGQAQARGAVNLTVTDTFTNSGDWLSGESLRLQAAKSENRGTLQALTLTAEGASLDNRGTISGITNLSLFLSGNLANQGTLLSDGDNSTTAKRFDNQGTLQAKNVTLQVDKLDNAGKIFGVSSLALTVANRLTNQQAGKLLSQGAAVLTAAEGVNTGEWQAKTLTLTANNLTNDGQIQGDDALSLTLPMTDGKGTLINRGTLTTGGDATLFARLMENPGTLSSRGQTTLTGMSLMNDGRVVAATGLSLRGDYQGRGLLNTAGTLTLHGDTLANDGHWESRALSLQGKHLNNQGSVLGNMVALSVDRLVNHGDITGVDTLTLSLGNSLNNIGTLRSDSLSVAAAEVNNRGDMQGINTLQLNTTGLLDNTGVISGSQSVAVTAGDVRQSGTLEGKTVTLDAASLTNQGKILGVDALTLSIAGNFSNDGNLLTQGNATVTAQSMDNRGLMQAGNLTLEADEVTNAGQLLGIQVLSVTAQGGLINQQRGKLLTQGAAVLQAARAENHGEWLANNLMLQAERFANTGRIQADRDLSVTVAPVSASRQRSFLPMALSLAADIQQLNASSTHQGSGATDGVLDNRGSLVSGRDLQLHATQIVNQGSLSGNGRATLTGNTIQNDGDVVAMKFLSLTGNYQGLGTLQTDGRLDWSGTTLTNRGRWQANAIQLQGHALDNQGTLLGQRTDITANTLFNGGEIAGVDALQLTVADRLTNQGQLYGATLGLSATGLFNQGELSGDALHLTLQGTVRNRGLMSGSQQVLLEANQVEQSGSLESRRLQVQANALDNQGTMLGVDALTLSIRDTARNQGKLLSQGTSTLTANRLENSGQWQAKTLALTADDIGNAGQLLGLSALSLTAKNRLDNTKTGTLLTQGLAVLNAAEAHNEGEWQADNLTLEAQTLNNRGHIQGDTSLTVTLENGDVDNQGTLWSKRADIAARTLTNAGEITGVNGLQLTLDDALTNQGALSSYQLIAQADRLDNRGKINGLDQLGITVNQNLNNTGTLYGAALALNTNDLTNSGTITGVDSLTLELNGTLNNTRDISSNALTLRTNDVVNHGTLTGVNGLTLELGNHLDNQGALNSQALAIAARDVTNGGLLNGTRSLQLTLAGTLINTGDLTSQRIGITAQNVLNHGQILGADDLQLELRNTLENRGLVSGSTTLGIVANHIDQQGTLEARALKVDAQTLDNHGKMLGVDALTLAIAGTARNQGKWLSQGSSMLTAGQVDNNGQWQAGDLTLQASDLTNSGQIFGINALSLTTTNDLSNQQGGTLLSQGIAVLRAANVTNDGDWQADRLTVDAQQLTNRGRIQGDHGLAITLDRANPASRLTNQGTVLSGGDGWLSASQLDNQGTVSGVGKLTLDSGAINNAGNVIADGALTLNGDYQGAGLLHTADTLTLRGNQLNNRGRWESRALALNGGSFSNGGTVIGERGITLELRDGLTVGSTGQILTNGALLAQAGNVSNDGLWQGNTLTLMADEVENAGQLLGLSSLTLMAKNRLDNTKTGQLLSQGQAVLNAAEVSNDGEWQADGLTLEAQNLNNRGHIQGDTSLKATLANGDVTNQGTLWSKLATIAARTLTNAGEITGVNGLQLALEDALTNQGALSSYQLTAQAGSLDNSGKINGLDQLGITVSQNLNNTGTLYGAAVTLNANDLTNRGTMTGVDSLSLSLNGTLNNTRDISSTALTLNANDVVNHGTMTGVNGLTLELGNHLDNQGTLNSQALAIAARDVTNGGRLNGTRSLQLMLDGTLTNTGDLTSPRIGITAQNVLNHGQMLGADDLQLDLRNKLDNRGLVSGSNTLGIVANDIDQQGTLEARALKVDAGTLDNHGKMLGVDALTLAIAGTARNQGKWLSQGSSTLTADQVDNNGQWQAGDITLQASELTNRGQIFGLNALSLTTTNDLGNQQGGTLLSQGIAVLRAANVTNDGDWQADRLTVDAQQLTNRGRIQGDHGLAITLDRANPASRLTNQGTLLSGGDGWLSASLLNNQGTVSGVGKVTLDSGAINNAGNVIADGALTLNGDYQGAGLLHTADTLTLRGNQLHNSGRWESRALALNGGTFSNTGTVIGERGITLELRDGLTVGSTGQILTNGVLLAQAGAVINDGFWQGNTLALSANDLTNDGTLLGQDALRLELLGSYQGNAQSRLLSDGEAVITADRLYQSGEIAAGTLNLTTNALDNSGRVLGSNDLTVTNRDELLNRAGGELLTNGAGRVDSGSFTNAGTLQANDLQLRSGEIDNQGRIQGTDALRLLDVLRYVGDKSSQLLSNGVATLHATRADNAGLWQAGTLLLNGDTFSNSGTVAGLNRLSLSGDALNNQGELFSQGTVTLTGKMLENSGTLTGVGGFTLQLTDRVDNLTTGRLLSGGTGELTTGVLRNQGLWQSDALQLTARDLEQRGNLLGVQRGTLQLSGTYQGAQGSQLVSGGDLSLTAHDIINRGQVQGKTLTLGAEALDNHGTLRGDRALEATVVGQFSNASQARLSSDGTLSVQAAALANQGDIKAATTTLTGNTLTNGGTVQGTTALQLDATDRIVNQQGGQLLSDGTTTLNAAAVDNLGWLQGRGLAVNTTQLTQQGSLMAQDKLTLKIPQWVNNGLVQAGELEIIADELDNHGTLLGLTQLALQTQRLINRQGAKLYSAQDLRLKTHTLQQDGQLVALGNLSADITGPLTFTQSMAAGKQLTLNVAGDLDQRGTLQGQSVQLTSTGTLTNQGNILAGGGESRLSAKDIVQAEAGSIQAGGNLTLVSENTLNNKGLIGTTGDLLVQAGGLLHNSSMLYAGGNMRLLSDSLTNVFGTILAGNNLLIQRDDQGAASTSLLNSSGTIETQSGDITINTGTLTNQREGFVVTETELAVDKKPQWFGGTRVNIPASWFKNSDYGIYTTVKFVKLSSGGGGNNGEGGRDRIDYSYEYVPYESSTIQKILTNSKDIEINVEGGTGKISSGNNVLINARKLENNASQLFSKNNLLLKGYELNNQSYQAGVLNEYLTYRYAGGRKLTTKDNTRPSSDIYVSPYIPYVLDASPTYEKTEGESYNALIQAGGTITADFKQDISNTTLQPGSGGFMPASTKPVLDAITTLSPLQKQTTRQLVSQDSSFNAGAVDVTNAGGGQATLAGNAAGVNATGKTVALTQQSGTALQAGAQADNITATIATPNTAGPLTLNTGDAVVLQPATSGHISNPDAVTLTPQSGTVLQTGAQADNITATITVPNTTGPLTLNTDGAVALQPSTSGHVSNPDAVALTSTGQRPDAGKSLTPVNVDNTAAGITIAGTVGTPAALATPGMAVIDAPKPTVSADSLPGGATPAVKPPLSAADLLSAIGNGLQNLSTNPLAEYPLPTGNNGLLVVDPNADSRYLIHTNPKLEQLGQVDNALFSDLQTLLGQQPSTVVPVETRSQWTQADRVLGSSYLLDKLNLDADHDYRFLGDAEFDTRYISQAVLKQSGQRHLNGTGSDLAQMQMLLDNAAAAQKGMNLQLGVSLTPEQVANLSQSLVWWENIEVNGQTVLAPKLYLAQADKSNLQGSAIVANRVELNAGGSVTNSGTLRAVEVLAIASGDKIDNHEGGLIKSDGGLNLVALNNITNSGSRMEGNTLQLASINGDIVNRTESRNFQTVQPTASHSGTGSLVFTELGKTAEIVAGNSLTLSAGKDIRNVAATLNAGQDMALNAKGNVAMEALTLTNNRVDIGWGSSNTALNTAVQGSTVTAGGVLKAVAGQDIQIDASALSGGTALTLAAGNDIRLTAQDTLKETLYQGGSTAQRRTQEVANSQLLSGGELTLVAGRDVLSEAASLNAKGTATLAAGRDLNLLSETEETYSGNWWNRHADWQQNITQQSTELTTGQGLNLQAGRDINLQAAQGVASGAVTAQAGNNINLLSATETQHTFFEETQVKKKRFSKTVTHTLQETLQTNEKGSLLSGDSVTLAANQDINLQGSSVVGDKQVTLLANNDVNTAASVENYQNYEEHSKKKSGLFSGGGIGFTIGSTSTSQKLRDQAATQSQSISTLGSTTDSVTVKAGNDVSISGTDMVAGKDILLQGNNVTLDPGYDTRKQQQEFEQKSAGLTVALSGVVGSALNSAVQSIQAAKSESDGRLALLQGMKAGLAGYQAYQGSQSELNNKGEASFVGVSISLGAQNSRSSQTSEQKQSFGSTLNAAGDIGIESRTGDITVAGSQLKAGGDVLMNAAQDIHLLSARNSEDIRGKNSSSGGNIGVSLGLSNGSAGLSIFANVNAAKGRETGTGNTWSETTVDAGNHVTLKSERDTRLTGAQVNGGRIDVDAGRNLLLQSQQDSDRYDSSQVSGSAGGSFTWGGGGGSGYISLSKDRMHSNYDSVQQQTGLFAGKDGFGIKTGEHTQLDAAVIASTASAEKNRLETGTLGWSGLNNKAEFKVEHSGAGFSASPSLNGSMLSTLAMNVPSALMALGSRGNASSTTYAAVSDGTLLLRDTAKQVQDIATLSRDVEHANNALSPIFNKEKEQKRLKQAQLIGEIGAQVMDIVRTEGELKAQKAAEARGDATVERPKDGDPVAMWEDYKKALTESPTYKAEMQKYGTGSDFQRAAQAATAAIQALAGGDIQKAIASGASPYLAQLVKDVTLPKDESKITASDIAANAMAHAVVGAVVAQLSGQDAAAGAIGASSGELAARAIMAEQYPGKTANDLTEAEKQSVSALSTLAAGLVSGLAGNGTASAASGAQSGRNAVENNALGADAGTALGFWLGKSDECGVACKAEIAKGVAEGNLIVSAGVAGVAGGVMIVGATPEIVAAAKAALEGCKAAPTICLNNAGLQVAEAVTPGGVGAAGAIGVGRTVAEATVAKAEAVAANAARNANNAASYAGLKMDLKTTEAANEIVDSLRRTGQLPPNYVNKAQARANGWKPGKALNNTNPDSQLGGDIFENSNNLLPSAPGRMWQEADIGLKNTMSRSNQPGTRLLYSNDGLLYITTDHYETATSIGKWK